MPTPDSPCFEVTIADRVAHIVLSRPDKMNSMIPEFWNDLPRIVRDIDRNAKARAIVISSTGKHFSSGMDLSVFARPEGVTGGGKVDPYVRAEKFRSDIRNIQASFNCLEEARIPVIACVQGGGIGGAVDLISACDIRYATADAFFCIQEINIAHDRRRRHLPAPVQADARRLGAPDGLHRRTPARGARPPARPRQRHVRHPGRDGRPRPRHRPRDRHRRTRSPSPARKS